MRGIRLASLHGLLGLPLFLVAGVLPAPSPSPGPPGEIRVSVSVLGNDQKRSPAQGAVVWIPGSAAAQPIPHGQIASHNKRFEPRVAAVPAGGTVDFPNLDKIHHNVFSLSETARFDLGLYKNGKSQPKTFLKPGLVRVYCNIHPSMAAYVMVVDGGIYALTGADGIAALSGVPPGRYPLKAWEERGGEWAGTVEVSAGKTAPVAVTLDATAYRAVSHTRKDGTAYPPPEDDENRY
jgi:plastocyanin